MQIFALTHSARAAEMLPRMFVATLDDGATLDREVEMSLRRELSEDDLLPVVMEDEETPEHAAGGSRSQTPTQQPARAADCTADDRHYAPYSHLDPSESESGRLAHIEIAQQLFTASGNALSGVCARV